MNQLGTALIVLACGTAGAVLSVAFLLMIPTDGASHGYRALIAEDLPVLVFTVAMGFGLGVLIALVWSVLQRLFAANAPRA